MKHDLLMRNKKCGKDNASRSRGLGSLTREGRRCNRKQIETGILSFSFKI